MKNTGAFNCADQTENPQYLEMAGRFILSLIQALLRTGYYLPDHPESQNAKKGIYDTFVTLAKRSGEITLYISEDGGKHALLIEGIAEGSISLASTMYRGMADTYMPKIIQFLERKELVSLSLKAALDEQEFHQLIDILSEPPANSQERTAARELFVAALTRQHIHNISFIFREDIITTRASLPWRVRMALSRLKKDLHLIPILQNLQEDELHHVKMQVLTDILRPLTVPALAYMFLLHLDLAASSMMSEQEGELHFFDVINGTLFLAVARLFLHNATSSEGFPAHLSAHKKSRLQTEFSYRLGETENHQASSLLEEYFDYDLISFEDLPAAMKNRIENIKRMEVFLKQPEKFLSSFDTITELPLYEPRVRILAGFVPLLLEREQVGEAVTVIQAITNHTQEQSERAVIAIKYRSAIAVGGASELAASIFISASKETRTLVGRLFSLIGSAAIPHVQIILSDCTDPWKIKQAAEILIDMGSNGVDGLLSSLESNRINHAVLPAVIRVMCECDLAGQKDRAVSLLLILVNDPLAEIRCEAVAGLARIKAAGNFSLFKARVDDPVIHVRKSAVYGIGRSADRRGGAFLIALIEKAEKTGKEEDTELAASAVEALAVLMTNCPAVYDTGFTCLSALTDRYCTRSAWKKLLAGSFVLPEALVYSLTEALGKLNDNCTRTLLGKLSQHDYPAVAKRATELISRQTGITSPGSIS